MRDFIKQYVGPMVLKPDVEIVRREAETPAETNTAPAKAEAVKRSIARERYCAIGESTTPEGPNWGEFSINRRCRRRRKWLHRGITKGDSAVTFAVSRY